MNTLSEIQTWYHDQCNGDWEHGYGVRIDTLDNPGWSVRITVRDTALESKSFTSVQHGVGDQSEEGSDDWMICRVENGEFVGYGGPFKLDEILRAFLDWKDGRN